MNLNWKATSGFLQGIGHKELNEPCQDRAMHYQDGELHAIVLADGAGSCKYSETGAELVTRLLTEHAGSKFEEWYEAENSAELIEEFLVQAIDREAEKYDHADRMDFSCTLLFVIVKGERYISGHIGDGVIVQRRNNQVSVLSYPENGLYINETYFITMYPLKEHFRIYKGVLEIHTDFMLMSDGVASSFYAYADREIDSYNTSVIFNHLVENDVSTVTEELQGLLEVISENTSDDCSLAVLISHTEDMLEELEAVDDQEELEEEEAPPIIDDSSNTEEPTENEQKTSESSEEPESEIIAYYENDTDDNPAETADMEEKENPESPAEPISDLAAKQTPDDEEEFEDEEFEAKFIYDDRIGDSQDVENDLYIDHEKQWESQIFDDKENDHPSPNEAETTKEPVEKQDLTASISEEQVEIQEELEDVPDNGELELAPTMNKASEDRQQQGFDIEEAVLQEPQSLPETGEIPLQAQRSESEKDHVPNEEHGSESEENVVQDPQSATSSEDTAAGEPQQHSEPVAKRKHGEDSLAADHGETIQSQDQDRTQNEVEPNKNSRVND